MTVTIEVLDGRNPAHYTDAQIRYAAALAAHLDRGRLLIVEPPANRPGKP